MGLKRADPIYAVLNPCRGENKNETEYENEYSNDRESVFFEGAFHV